MLLRARAIADELRESLFFIPALYILASLGLAWGLIQLDRALHEGVVALPVPVLVAATVESARATLSMIAGATITVAGITFSVMIVSVQLASSQFSPRVLRGFLRDPFAQHVIGIVVATFTYCLLVLTTVRRTTPVAEEATATAAVTVGVALGVVAIIAIVAFIDRSARRMQVGQIIDRVADETLGLIAGRLPPRGETPGQRVERRDPAMVAEEASAHRPPEVIRSPASGWIQQLEPHPLLASLPPGAIVRLDVRVGHRIARGTRLARIWGGEAEDPDLRDVLVIGPRRTMQQDIAFGLRQLIDIGLRALSPGINDPTTAYEVLAAVTEVLAELQTRALPQRVIVDDEDRRLYWPAELGWADYVALSFDQMRIAGAAQPAVMEAMLHRLGQLTEMARGRELAQLNVPLHEQVEMILAGLEHQRHIEQDEQRLREAAAVALDGEPAP